MSFNVSFDNDRDTLSRIERLVERNAEAIAKLEVELKQSTTRWDERFYQLSKDNIILTRNLLLAAVTVAVLSPLIQALAPTIQAFFNK